MADTTPGASPAAGRWAVRDVPPGPRSIVESLRSGTLDAELAATLWALIEARVPVLVAGAPGTGRSTLLAVSLDLVPSELRIVRLGGASETFDWLPQAGELGWRRTAPLRPPDPGASPVRPDTTVFLADELSDGGASSTWGEVARIAIRAASIGYGLAATVAGDGLDEVLAALRRAPVEASDDELSRLGIVLILRHVSPDRRRVVAAHYLRPVARDEHGHVQRLGPAVLATWDAATDGFEHFGWGITPELALRIGRRAGDFELEVDARRRFLAELVASGISDPVAVRTALAEYRPLTPAPPT